MKRYLIFPVARESSSATTLIENIPKCDKISNLLRNFSFLSRIFESIENSFIKVLTLAKKQHVKIMHMKTESKV
jgi:hypothetical protein